MTNMSISYNTEMCEKVIVIMSNGGSLHEVAKALGVDIDTVKEWRTLYPMFDSAIEAGLIFAEERGGKKSSS
jgi:hypothetical protein